MPAVPAMFVWGVSAMLVAASTFSCAAIRGSGGVGAGRDGTGVKTSGGEAAREVTAVPLGSLTIRKWRLNNGLEIITVPDAGARGVSYLTVFRVGSRDENAAAGETGLAHLFEHLMFTGTRAGMTAPDFDQQIEEVGGTSNAQTYYDFTSYIDEVSPQALERAIGLEADRMLNLALGEKLVANERDVVIQERLGTVEDSVDGTLDEMVWQQAFRTHPYRWPVIGTMADIKAINKDKAMAFYRRHYAPNRAVIVVAGAFDEPATLQAIGVAYGGLAAAPPIPSDALTVAPERAPATEVRARVERPVLADRMVIGYPAPGLGDPDRAIYDVANELLTGGPSSRLYRLLVVDRAIASSMEGDVAPTRDQGLWCLWVQMTKGNEARRAEELILAELARLAREPVSEAELARAKNHLETDFWRELGSSRGRAEALGHFDVTAGDFRKLLQRSALYDKVTADDVMRVAHTVLEPGARSVVVATPGALH